MVVFVSYILVGATPNAFLLTAAFFITLSVYNMNRVFDKDEDAINFGERSRIFRGHEKAWLFVSSASLAVAIALGASVSFSSLLVLLIPPVSGAFYSVRLRGLPRLKDLTGVKSLVVASGWALTSFGLVVSGAGGMSVAALLVAVFVFIKLLVNTVLFDIRDMNGDDVVGIKTLPLSLGPARTRALLMLLNLALAVWLLASYALGYFQTYLLPLAFSVIYGFVFTYALSRGGSASRHWFDVVVDGEWLPLGLLIMLT